jgi:hypothetical protein
MRERGNVAIEKIEVFEKSKQQGEHPSGMIVAADYLYRRSTDGAPSMLRKRRLRSSAKSNRSSVPVFV